MRQRTKLGLALLVLALVLGGVVVGGVELFRQGTFEQAEANLQQSADTVANQTAVELRGELQRLQTLSTRPGLSQRSAVGETLAGFVRHSRFEVAVFVAPNGTITAARGIDPAVRNETIGANIGDETYIQRALDGRADERSEIGPPVRDAAAGEYVVQAANPVTNAEGEIVGAVAGSMPVSEVTGSVRAIDTSERTARLSAWNGSSEVVLREQTREFEGVLSANATVPVEGTAWIVTVLQDRGPINERLDRLTALQFGSLLIVFVGVVALGYWEYTTNLRQTERLLEGFRRLREGDYEYTVSLSSATEWQRISDGYNELTMGLAEREREIREREQQLEVLNRVLRHNLQNDMNVIIGHAEMLPRYSEDDRVENAAETIVRMGEELVSHGQKARQLESAMGRDVSVTTVAVSDAAAAAVGTYRREYPDVTFRLQGAEDATATALESFEAAVDNLVENAAEYNDDPDPFVEVEIETGEDTVSVHVRDNGPGIPEHEREVLSAGAESALKHGSGVGLWLAYWIVDRSGGELTFADRSPRGSVVTIELDAATGSEPAGESSSPDESRALSLAADVDDRADDG